VQGGMGQEDGRNWESKVKKSRETSQVKNQGTDKKGEAAMHGGQKKMSPGPCRTEKGHWRNPVGGKKEKKKRQVRNNHKKEWKKPGPLKSFAEKRNSMKGVSGGNGHTIRGG